jgi:hypothetical protein
LGQAGAGSTLIGDPQADDSAVGRQRLHEIAEDELVQESLDGLRTDLQLPGEGCGVQVAVALEQQQDLVLGVGEHEAVQGAVEAPTKSLVHAADGRDDIERGPPGRRTEAHG